MVIAIREFTHEELLAAKYTECEAQKHSKVFIYVFVLFHIKHRSSIHPFIHSSLTHQIAHYS